MATAKKRATASSGVTLVNPGSTPVVYDHEGHSLGGGERVTVETLDDVGRKAVDRGYLLIDTWSGSEESDAPQDGGASDPDAPDQVG